MQSANPVRGRRTPGHRDAAAHGGRPGWAVLPHPRAYALLALKVGREEANTQTPGP